jgi:hydrogenase maturation protein HypF
MDTILKKITIRGVVQGVGFRPFVYNLAERFELYGWVLNNSAGVEIEAEGSCEAVEAFVAALRDEAPPLSHIESLEAQEAPLHGYDHFEIRHSERQEGRYQLISPDIATCPDCLRELLDPADRRHRYPFINCTNCGPRFTIIADIPYDRPSTTMRAFVMCPNCQREYDDPRDRRFHAQPNACPVCGPELRLVSGSEFQISSWEAADATLAPATWNLKPETDIISQAAAMLQSGAILAIKGLGGFHLACDATNAKAVHTLRERKRRPDKPFAVMIATLSEVMEQCVVSPEEEALLASPQCPIVLLPWRPTSNIVAQVAPNNRYLGVMLPYTPLHHVLLRDVGRPLVMTSGNLTEEPIAAENEEALRRLALLADAFVLHNRGIYARYDDSVWFVPRVPSAHVASVYSHSEERAEAVPPLDEESPAIQAASMPSGNASLPPVAQNDNPTGSSTNLEPEICQAETRLPQPIRRARGYAPFPMKLPFKTRQILACGAEIKNTFCLARDEYAFVSQHIGDMENLETLEHYQRTVDLYKHLFRVEPEVIAYDLHPDYLASRYAREQVSTFSLRPVTIQHHHAHLAACLADNGWRPEDGPVIGVSLDGTGYGADGRIWGGEWLVGDYQSFRRAAHLEYLPLPGGDLSTRKPWRIAYSYLYTLLGEVPAFAVPQDVSKAEVVLLRHQIDRQFNCPLTSSMGRLFDAVSAMLGVRARTSYEAQAAIELEMRANGHMGKWADGQMGKSAVRNLLADQAQTWNPYPFGITMAEGRYVIGLVELFAGLLSDVRTGAAVDKLAVRFHQTVARLTVEVCERIAGDTGLRTVALSGGCFQNRLLLALTLPALRDASFEVLHHRQVPCNDGGLSLGQAAIAHFATYKNQ